MRAALLSLALLASTSMAFAQDLDLPYEKHVLDNGLQVLIHEDHSDAVVSVYLVYHVGSAREELGRSGFAHLFEHLMFQGSANVGNDQHFKLVSEAGGTLNGSTNRDRTNYFETLPSHQLELALWLEADRMGFLLPAITQENLDNQREVVKNERRQNYENRPYGQAAGRIAAAMYPPEHPYSWITIGSHEDLTAASMEDVMSFFRRWYGPNNCTLAVGGDVDPTATLALVNTYFGPIPRGPDVADPRPRPVSLEQDVRLVMEDKVQLPQISFTWATPARGDSDNYALDLLSSVLSANKSSLLDRALTVDEVLASRVSAWNQEGDLASEFSITVRAAPGVHLDTLETRVRGLLEGLARDGVDADQLQRMKNRLESQMIMGLETVARRTRALADANALSGTPDAVAEDLARTLRVTTMDVERVLEKYIVGEPSIVMSVVPEGELGQAASGRTVAQLTAEAGLDRKQQPAAAEPRAYQAPTLWHDTLANGVTVTGTRYGELPVVSVSLSVPGGHLREPMDKLGLSSLTASLMDEGTEDLSTTELADALDFLGATVSVRSSDDELTVSARTLTRHVPATIALMQDVLLRPRFDPADFERLKAQRLSSIETRGDSIRTITGNVWDRLMYGDGTPAAWPSSGTLDTVPAITLDDVRRFHADHVVPGGARLTVVGDLGPDQVRELFGSLAREWTGGRASPIAAPARPSIASTGVYLVNKPGAPQSEIRIGHPSVARTDPDHYPLTVMNYTLGGTFSSRINMNLREDKGYTYGARSGFDGDLRTGTFSASSGVRTDVSMESVVEFMNELQGALDGFTEEEAEFARAGLMQAMGRQTESIMSLASVVDRVSKDGLPDDYLEQRRAWLESFTVEDLDALAAKGIDPTRMLILVVGDAELVGESLEALGYGPVQELDIDGNPVEVGDA